MVSQCSYCINTDLLTPACKTQESGPAEISRCSQPFSPLSPPGRHQTALCIAHEMLCEPSSTQILTYGILPFSWSSLFASLPSERVLLPFLGKGYPCSPFFMTVSESPPLRISPWSPGPDSFKTDSHRLLFLSIGALISVWSYTLIVLIILILSSQLPCKFHDDLGRQNLHH